MIPKASSSYSQAWTDDYLDLYNYAASIGDTQWQEELLHTLRSKESFVEAWKNESALRSLWSIYDSINHNLLELFRQLRDTANPEEAQVLREQMWDLKCQRLEIARKIRSK